MIPQSILEFYLRGETRVQSCPKKHLTGVNFEISGKPFNFPKEIVGFSRVTQD